MFLTNKNLSMKFEEKNAIRTPTSDLSSTSARLLIKKDLFKYSFAIYLSYVTLMTYLPVLEAG